MPAPIFLRMVWFDVGATLFCTGLMLLVWFLLKSQKNYQVKLVLLICCIVMEIAGGVLMVVAHYLLAGNSSVFTNLIS